MQSIAVISENKVFLDRVKLLAENFKVPLHIYPNSDTFTDTGTGLNPQVVILDSILAKDANETTGNVQAVKFTAPKSELAVVVAKKVETEAALFIKKSGATAVLLEDELLDNSKIEFVVARAMNGEWIPIKVSDLMVDKPVSFVLYHLMPLHRKFLAFLQKNQILAADRMKKYEAVGEFYIRKEDLPGFREYAKNNLDNSAGSLRRRCRAVYLSLVDAYRDLVMVLTDQSEGASFQAGKELYAKMILMSQELISSLASYGEPTEVINNAEIADVTAVDRAPAIAAFAGLLSLELGIGKPEEVMVAALLADIGLLDLPVRALAPVRLGQWDQLRPEDLKTYQYHPTISLNKALSRKMSIEEDLKKVILCTHERADGKGFPGALLRDKIPDESFLIRFAEEMDRASLVRFGEPRLKPSEVKKKMLDQYLTPTSGYPMDLMMKIRQHLMESVGPKQ